MQFRRGCAFEKDIILQFPKGFRGCIAWDRNALSATRWNEFDIVDRSDSP